MDTVAECMRRLHCHWIPKEVIEDVPETDPPNSKCWYFIHFTED